jgi:hypothetical protein
MIGVLYPHSLGSWNISEFLINYQEGFVRRGLTGEILFLLVKYCHIDVILTVKALCLALYVWTFMFFVCQFRKKGFSLYIIPLCFFMGSMVLNYDYWLRKDCLMFAFFIYIVKTFVQDGLSRTNKILIINILLIVVLLIHEVFIFYALPIVVLLLGSSKKLNFRNFFTAGLCFAIPVLVFFIVVTMHGNEATAQGIWDSWSDLLHIERSKVNEYNGLGGIGWSSYKTFLGVFSMSFLYNYHGIPSGIEWIITFPLIYYLSINLPAVFGNRTESFSKRHQTAFSAVLIFQFVCLLPVMLFLMCDYGRVSFLWIGSSFTLLLLVPLDRLESAFPHFLFRFTEWLNRRMNSFLKPAWTTLFILILLTGMNFTNGDFAASNILKSSMIYHICWPFVEIAKAILLLLN